MAAEEEQTSKLKTGGGDSPVPPNRDREKGIQPNTQVAFAAASHRPCNHFARGGGRLVWQVHPPGALHPVCGVTPTSLRLPKPPPSHALSLRVSLLPHLVPRMA
jgi:hypothetical protein